MLIRVVEELSSSHLIPLLNPHSFTRSEFRTPVRLRVRFHPNSERSIMYAKIFWHSGCYAGFHSADVRRAACSIQTRACDGGE